MNLFNLVTLEISWNLYKLGDKQYGVVKNCMNVKNKLI